MRYIVAHAMTRQDFTIELRTTIPSVKLVPLETLDRQVTELLRLWRNNAREWFIDSALIAEAQHHEWLVRYLESGDEVMWVVQQDGVPCGTLSLSAITLTTAELGNTLLVPWRQRCGIMAACVHAVLAHAWAANLYGVTLSVLPHNDAALKLYERCGFKRTGFMKTNSGSVARMWCMKPEGMQ